MTINLTLPLGKKDNLKNLVFSILVSENPLRTIELLNTIRKRYGRSVTFQAVRKAANELEQDGVLVKNKEGYSLNKIWVLESKRFFDHLHIKINQTKTNKQSSDSIGGNMSVFTFNSVNEMIKFWYSLMDDWIRNFKRGDPNINCYQTSHIWEVVLHPDQERTTMLNLKRKGIKSYAFVMGNSKLDETTISFYRKIGIKTAFLHSRSYFDRSYSVGTYGDMIIQTQYPKEILKMMDLFFKKSKDLHSLDLIELSQIMNKKAKLKLTVIKNLEMAKQINNSILKEMD